MLTKFLDRNNCQKIFLIYFLYTLNFLRNVRVRGAGTWCGYVVRVRGAGAGWCGYVVRGTRCGYVVQVCGAGTWCGYVYVMRVRGTGTWCRYAVRVRGAGTWCVFIKRSKWQWRSELDRLCY